MGFIQTKTVYDAGNVPIWLSIDRTKIAGGILSLHYHLILHVLFLVTPPLILIRWVEEDFNIRNVW